MNTQIEKLMKTLDITEAEARKIIADDKVVDKMKDSEVTADLTEEQKKISKKMRNFETKTKKKPIIFSETPKTRKKNPKKQEIIEGISNFLIENYENVQILNPDRLIAFSIGEEKFEITLVAKRKPKA